MDSPATRRSLLKMLTALAPLGTAAPFALNLAAAGSAAAATASDYRALVCVFMVGGNDCHNTVLATDAANWRRYWQARWTGVDPIALMPKDTPAYAIGATSALTNISNPDGSARAVAATSPERWGGVIPITQGHAVHPMLLPLFKATGSPWADGRLAVLPNVGPLVRPTTKQEIVNRQAVLPGAIASHNDQISIWQSMMLEGGRVGWGGRMAEILADDINQKSAFTAISASGSALFLAGRKLTQFPVRPSAKQADAVASTINNPSVATAWLNTTARAQLTDVMKSPTSSSDFENDYAAFATSAIDNAATLNTLTGKDFSLTPIPTFLDPNTGGKPENTLASQLASVARIIRASQNAGIKRQVFFVAMGGFDTHNYQNASQPGLLARVAHALSWFDGEMQQAKLSDRVTTFTMSDFGRTFNSNGSGTDHAWGGHHFILGGAVQGKKMYGTYPTLGVDGQEANFTNPDMLGSFLVPSTSVVEYATVLGRWFGLTAAQVQDVFPSAGAFKFNNLAFMKTPTS